MQKSWVWGLVNMSSSRYEKVQRVRITCLIVHGNEILLMRRIIEDEGLDIWEFPSGTPEFGEDPEKTAEREAREETSLELEKKGLFATGSCTYFLHGKHYHEIVIAFLFEAKDKDVKLSFEHVDAKWVKPEELFKIPNLALTIRAIMPRIKEYYGVRS